MINVGIIGLGRSGWDLHAASLHTYADYHIAAVCDQSAARSEQAANTFGARSYSDPEALIEDPAVHLVVIATPVSYHAGQAIAALQAGKHVVVEKPMATTRAEVDAMVAAARQTGRLLTVFHNRHWDPDYRLLKHLVRHGILGDLLTIDSRIMMYGALWPNYGVPEFNPQWRLQSAYGGGYLADWGPHMLEQCLDLVDAWPISVNCVLRSDVWSQEVEDYFSLRLVFPSGLIVTLEGSNNARIPLPRWFVVGRNGTLIAPGNFGSWTDMRVCATIAGIDVELTPRDTGPEAARRKYNTGHELSDFFYANLAEALDTGRPPAIPVERAREVMLILDAARRSHTAGQPVSLEAREG